MADANVHSGKTGNPRIAIVLKKEDYNHLVKLAMFLKYSHKIVSQVSYRMSPYHLPNVLSKYSDTAVFCSSICS
jgi:hypothetical protein